MNTTIGTQGLFKQIQITNISDEPISHMEKIRKITDYHLQYKWKIEHACEYFGMPEATYYRCKKKLASLTQTRTPARGRK